MSRVASCYARWAPIAAFALLPGMHAFALPDENGTARGPCQAYEQPPRPVPFFAFILRPPTPINDTLNPKREYPVKDLQVVSTLGERSRWLLIEPPGSPDPKALWVYAGPDMESSARPDTWVCEGVGRDDR